MSIIAIGPCYYADAGMRKLHIKVGILVDAALAGRTGLRPGSCVEKTTEPEQLLSPQIR